MRIFGYEITIKKVEKSAPPKLTDKELAKLAIQKYLKEPVTIMGLCGDVEKGLIIGFVEIYEQYGIRYARFNTSNEDYCTVSFSEDVILS